MDVQCLPMFHEFHLFMWPRQTSGMVSYVARVSSTKTRSFTLLQGPFTANHNCWTSNGEISGSNERQ